MSHDEGRTSPSSRPARRRTWWSPPLRAAHGRPSRHWSPAHRRSTWSGSCLKGMTWAIPQETNRSLVTWCHMQETKTLRLTDMAKRLMHRMAKLWQQNSYWRCWELITWSQQKEIPDTARNLSGKTLCNKWHQSSDTGRHKANSLSKSLRYLSHDPPAGPGVGH